MSLYNIIQSLLKESELPTPLQRSRKYAKEHSVYQASKHFNLSLGTIGPWIKIDFSKENTVVFRVVRSGRKLSYPNGEGGTVGSMGPGTARSTSSSLYTAHHRPSQADHSAFYSILSRNQRLGSEIHETKQPLFAS